MMKDLWPKFLLIGGLTLAGIYCMLPPSEKLKLGIDLSGGTILVYQAKDAAGGGGGSGRMDDLVAALKRRINGDGLRDIPIRKIGSNRVEIIMAKASDEDVAELKHRITDVGQLEFRILANRKHDSAAIERALAPNGVTRTPKGYKWVSLGETVAGKDPKLAGRVLTDPTRAFPPDRYADKAEVTLVGTDAKGKELVERIGIKGNTPTALTLKKAPNLDKVTSYSIDFNPSGIRPSEEVVVRDEPRGNGQVDRLILLKLDKQDVTGAYLDHVSQTTDERVQPAVRFVFKPLGGRKFGNLTREHSPELDGFLYRLAIVLDDMVMSAPVIKSEIRDEGVIEGVAPREIEHLILILRSGSLPASLDPIPLLEEKVGPTLGRDTITKGLWAIGVSMVVVPIFMIFYYHFAGVVAVVALVLNILLLVGSMALFHSTITLPGLAGLALTIGMAVDANVLIFERMREEKERGASLAQQIRQGFARAWITILDSHLTVLLSGLVLFAIGTEEVKGFALTLFIGMVWNLFTAVYVSRVIFDLYYGQGWLKRLTMLKMLNKTSIDFISPRKYMMTASVITILLGLAAVAYKGKSLFNIDFTGGTLVTIQLDDDAPALKGRSESSRAEYVRGVAGATLPDAAVESLNVGNELRGVRFNIRTTEQNSAVVQAKVQDAFKDSLARLILTAGPGVAIPPAPKPADPKAVAPTGERFAGGQEFDLKFNKPVEPGKVRASLVNILRARKASNPELRFELARVGEGSTLPNAPAAELSMKTDLDPADAQVALDSLKTDLRDNSTYLFDRLENFGGAVAGETRTLALIAIVASWLIIVGFLWFRFHSATYGVAALLSLVHDVLITLGAVAISPYKIDLPMIAAFLTLIGFSVNDTIVIFDRIREIKGKTPVLTKAIINDALNQTLSRTILTSLTAWLVVLILYIFGGEGLRGFSFCLVVGFLSGTYSTVYIATPVLIDFLGGKPKPAAANSKLVASR